MVALFYGDILGAWQSSAGFTSHHATLRKTQWQMPMRPIEMKTIPRKLLKTSVNSYDTAAILQMLQKKSSFNPNPYDEDSVEVI